MDKWDIFCKIIKAAATNKPNRCVVYLPGEVEFSHFIRMDSLNYDIKDEVCKLIKNIFNIKEDQIKDADKEDYNPPSDSFKGRNPNHSTSEKTRLVISDDSIEIGSYTGKFYDYYVLRNNNGQ